MKVTAITSFVARASRGYDLGSGVGFLPPLPASRYSRRPGLRELYGTRVEACLTRVETDSGLVGWGESQAPVGPEIAQAIVTRVLAPVVLGQDPFRRDSLYAEMLGSMHARGQFGGYQLDALASVDTALWDLTGRALGVSVNQLVGGPHRVELPCYVSGLTAASQEGRREEAHRHTASGFVGVKPFLGRGLAEDEEEAVALRSAIPQSAMLIADVLGRYRRHEALNLGRRLEGAGVDVLESPVPADDLDGHAELARALDIPIAAGEALRTRAAFLPWLRRQAIDIAQPDVMRNGITETLKIAALAEAFGVPVALHNGAVTSIGMAATWHVAASIDNFLVQELEPQMLELFNPWLRTPLEVRNGCAVVPPGPGLGIELDEERFRADVVSEMTVAHGS